MKHKRKKGMDIDSHFDETVGTLNSRIHFSNFINNSKNKHLIIFDYQREEK